MTVKAGKRGAVELFLTSPTGTTSQLLIRFVSGFFWGVWGFFLEGFGFFFRWVWGFFGGFGWFIWGFFGGFGWFIWGFFWGVYLGGFWGFVVPFCFFVGVFELGLFWGDFLKKRRKPLTKHCKQPFFHHKTSHHLSKKLPQNPQTPIFRRNADASEKGFLRWSFMSTHSWGENPRGQWTLVLTTHNTTGGGGKGGFRGLRFCSFFGDFF